MRLSAAFPTKVLPVLLALLLPPLLLGAAAPASPPAVDDGPHVHWEGGTARVLELRQGKVVESRLAPPYDLALPGLRPLRLDPAGPEPRTAVLPLPGRIAAVSDVHGNLDGLVELLRAHCVVDGRNDWTFGKGHLVVAGDVFDRGSRVAATFWLLRQLESQARAAGGAVHVLLGNHEVGALRGDERYVHPALARAEKELLGLDQQTLYGPSWELGRWLRSLPVLLKLGPILFAHGGPSPEMAAEEKPLDPFNAAVRQALDAGRESGDPAPARWPPARKSPASSGTPRLLGRASPIWYRGLIPGAETKRPNADDEQVAKILETFEARLIVVGHTPQPGGITAYRGGRVHAIDAELQEGRSGQIWLFQDGKCYRGLPDGRTEPLGTAGAIGP